MSLKSTIDDLRKYRNLVLVLFVFCMVSTLSFLTASNMKHSSAASLSGFKAGNIISDAVMSNYNSMTKDEIQAFLTQKNPCNNKSTSQYQSLKKQYPNLEWHFENGHFVCLSEEKFGDGTTIGEGQTAAEIIYQAAQDYKINPQVLIVLLEKEQSLITDTYPNSKQYRSATGYGCPDTAACDTKYYGFKNQVRNAAALFRNVLDNGYSAYPEKKSGVYIGYNPNSSCGRSEVYIENRATAALYRYTPYQPNASALAAGYGTGDSCSAYGNRNFYLYFTDWFGSTQIAPKVDGEQINIPTGEYAFTSQLSDNRALGVASGNGNGTRVQIVEYNSSDARQKWKVEQTSDGYYRFIHSATGRALSLTPNQSVADGNQLQLWDKQDVCSQKWKVYAISDSGNLSFESACMSGMVIDLSNGSANVGNAIQVWTTNGLGVQRWNLRTGRTLADGIYNLRSERNTSRVVDIAGGSNTNGTNVIYWDSIFADNQEWQFKYDSKTDSYAITNPYNHKSLDAANGTAMYNGKNIQLWDYNGSCVQRWKVIPRGDNYMLLSTCSLGYALDLNGDLNYTNGSNIQLWSVHDGVQERWRIEKSAPAVADGTYNIALASDSSKLVDSTGAYNSANVALSNSHDGDSAKWRFTYHANDGTYSIINVKSGYALDLSGESTYNGNNIQLWESLQNCAQRWYIIRQGNAYQLLSACNRYKAVDMADGRIVSGANIQLWDKNTGFAQKWVFQKR